VHVSGQSKGVSVHAVVMTIKDCDEGIRIIAERRRPVRSLVSCRSHYMYCPYQGQRYTNQEKSRRIPVKIGPSQSICSRLKLTDYQEELQRLEKCVVLLIYDDR
jgi:hypothetical protein